MKMTLNLKNDEEVMVYKDFVHICERLQMDWNSLLVAYMRHFNKKNREVR